LPIKAKKQYLDLDPGLPHPTQVTKEAIIPDALHILDL
jgi:hypothetical protein